MEELRKGYQLRPGELLTFSVQEEPVTRSGAVAQRIAMGVAALFLLFELLSPVAFCQTLKEAAKFDLPGPQGKRPAGRRVRPDPARQDPGSPARRDLRLGRAGRERPSWLARATPVARPRRPVLSMMLATWNLTASALTPAAARSPAPACRAGWRRRRPTLPGSARRGAAAGPACRPCRTR